MELKTLELITLQLVTSKEDNQTVVEVWPQLKNKSILTDTQISNTLLVDPVMVQED